MKKILIAFLITIFTIPCFAGAKLIDGSLQSLAGEKTIPVYTIWEDAVYGKCGDINDFLALAERKDDWNAKSVSSFLKAANQSTLQYGTRFVTPDKVENAKYYIEIETLKIKEDGNILGNINVFENGTKNVIAVVNFSSDERDDDDEYGFRDQFESLGEKFGNIFVKEVKKVIK